MKTLFDLLDEFIDYMRSLKFSRHTVRSYHYNVRRALRWLRDKHELIAPERLRIGHLHAWQKHLSKQNTRAGRPFKARTINKQIENMRGFLEFMARRGHVQNKLAVELRSVKEPKELPGSVLTHEQMRKLLDSVATDTSSDYCVRTMLEMLYSTGVRVSELIGLNIDSADLVNRTAVVTGKGNKQRVVPIGKTALRFLGNYIKAIRPYLLDGRDDKALFIDPHGKRMTYERLRQIILSCAENAGMDVHVTAHTFRRSCTTELLRGGAGMYHVKELLGHESLQSLKHYAKLTIMDLKETHRRCHPREKDAEERGAED